MILKMKELNINLPHTPQIASKFLLARKFDIDRTTELMKNYIVSTTKPI